MSFQAPPARPLDPGLSRAFVIPFCGVMLAMNAISCDILLPALFAIQGEFGASIERVQTLIPLFLLAAAVGQIIFGPASDRFGRRPVLMVGLAVYCAGSIIASLSTSLGMLQVARLIQGFGAACAVVLARAILRDTHSGPELARAMALAMAIFAIGPLFAPLIGALTITVADWRTLFRLVTLVGAALLVATAMIYRETNAHLDPRALAPSNLKAAFLQVVTHAQSRHFLIVAVMLQFVVVLFVANAPRLFRSGFGIEGLAFAALFAFAAVGIVIGQLLSNRMIARIGVVRTLRTAVTVLAAAVALIALFAVAGRMTAPVFTGLLFFYNAAFLVVFANAMSLVLEPHRSIAGFASALLGCLTQFIGNALALATLPLLDGTLAAWSLVQAGIVAGIVALAFAYRPRPAPHVT